MCFATGHALTHFYGKVYWNMDVMLISFGLCDSVDLHMLCQMPTIGNTLLCYATGKGNDYSCNHGHIMTEGKKLGEAHEDSQEMRGHISF